MLVFIHINKTAGRTVRYILRSSYGARHCEVEPWHAPWDGPPFSAADLRRLRKIYPRLASIAGHRLTGFADLGEQGPALRYFTFLRDPVALCASRFQYHIEYRKKKGVVFEEWIGREWLRDAQTKQIGGTSSVDDAVRMLTTKAVLVGLTERFDESLVLLKGLRARDLDIDYVPVNVARTNKLANELLSNPSTRQAIVDANSSDVALYDYVKSELYPSIQRDYGSSLADDVAEYQKNRNRGFNARKLTASRLKQYGVYQPLLHLYRKKTTRKIVEKVLG